MTKVTKINIEKGLLQNVFSQTSTVTWPLNSFSHFRCFFCQFYIKSFVMLLYVRFLLQITEMLAIKQAQTDAYSWRRWWFSQQHFNQRWPWLAALVITQPKSTRGVNGPTYCTLAERRRTMRLAPGFCTNHTDGVIPCLTSALSDTESLLSNNLLAAS